MAAYINKQKVQGSDAVASDPSPQEGDVAPLPTPEEGDIAPRPTSPQEGDIASLHSFHPRPGTNEENQLSFTQQQEADLPLPGLTHGSVDDVAERGMDDGLRDVLRSHTPVYNVEGEPRFGDVHVHTSGPVFNAPVVFTIPQTPEPAQRSSVSVASTPSCEETSPNLPTAAASTIPTHARTGPSLSTETQQTAAEPRSGMTSQATSIQQNPPTSHTTIPQSTAPVSQQSIQSAPSDQCGQLKTLLKERARTIATEESSLAEFVQQPITTVNLSIVSKPQQVEDEFQMEGHYHRREDLVKIYKRPESDITAEEMFPSARSKASHEADRKFKTSEANAKQHYVEKHGNVIGVVGQAGIGKTTSAKKWALQAIDGCLFGNVSFIFYIAIRLVNFTVKMTFLQFLVSSMLPEWSCTSEEANNIISVLCDDPNVLLIFDGLDEADFVSFAEVVAPPLLAFKSKAENYLKHLAGGNLLPRARKIFTSRPAQLYKLHPAFRPKFIVQILGLTPQSQDELGQTICGAKYGDIRRKLTQNSNLFAYCYVPVNFILTLNYLMNYDGDIQFVSLTRVLTFTCGQYSVSEHLKGLECELDKLAKMAWVGFLNKKVVFYFVDFRNAGINDTTADAFLNTSVAKRVNLKLTILDGHKLRYFSHLIWQEFFAAFYLMMIMPLEKFSQHIATLTEDRWEVVAKFAFGICDGSVFRELLFLVPNCSTEDWMAKKMLLGDFVGTAVGNGSKVEIKRICSWAYESNDVKIALTVCSALPVDIDLSSSLLPIDVANLSFVLQTEKVAALKKLDLSWNNIGNHGATTVATGIHNLTELELHHCDIRSRGIEQISSKIQALQKPLKKLDLSGNQIGDIGATLLAPCIYNTEVLLIYDCRIGNSGQEKLTDKILFLPKPMTRLDISFNHVGDFGSSLLAGCITNIRELVLKTCQIGAKGMGGLSGGIQRLSTPLAHLELSGNKIGDLGATFLASCVHKIRVLILYDCEIGIKGAEKLSEKIKALHKPMKEFDISMNQIGDSGAKSLARCVHNFEVLMLCGCGIGCEGAKALAGQIQMLKTPMQRCALCWNRLTDESAESLAACGRNISELDVSDCGLTVAGKSVIQSNSEGKCII